MRFAPLLAGTGLSALLMAVPARADITDSGTLVIGGTATIQGNAFSVGGTTLAATGGWVGVGLSTPTSRLHVHDGDIRITTATGSRGIIFQDGTTQTAAAAVSVSSVIVTFGNLANVQTFLSKCVGGSTTTITLASSADVHLRFYGTLNGNPSTIYRVGYLRDGAYGTGQSSSKGMANLGGQGQSPGFRYDWFDVIEGETAGTHSYCITVASDGAPTTVTFPYDSANEQARFAAYTAP